MKESVCKICNFEGKPKTNSIIRHVQKAHNIDKKDYYDKFIKTETEGYCLNCGKDTRWKPSINSKYGIGYLKFCNRNCNLKYRWKDSNYRNSQLEKYKKQWDDPKRREKQADIASMMREKAYSNSESLQKIKDNGKKQISKLHKKLYSNSNHKEKLSKNACKMIKDPQSNFGYSQNIKYRNVYFKSAIECKFAKFLDSKKIKWQYEPKTFEVNLEGRIRYTPDFYIPEMCIWIEIKPDRDRLYSNSHENEIRKFFLDRKIKFLQVRESDCFSTLLGRV